MQTKTKTCTRIAPLAALTAVAALALTTAPARADAPFWPGLYAAANITSSASANEREERHGNSVELGASLVLVQKLGLDLFYKRLTYSESDTNDAGSKTELSLTDNMVGFGGRFIGRGYYLKLGRALHDTDASKKTDGQDVAGAKLPDGRDAGLFLGAGLWLPLGGGVEAFADFTRYQLSQSRYKIDEITIGARLSLGDGGPKWDSK